MRGAILLAMLAGCGTAVDTAGLPSIDGYHDWPFVSTSTAIPGHGDTLRIIYFNLVARTYPHGGRYPVGSVFVKDVFAKNADGSAGSLREISIMRKLGEDATTAVQDGWLFTDLKDGSETQKDSCFSTCHRNGPFDDAYFDHGQ